MLAPGLSHDFGILNGRAVVDNRLFGLVRNESGQKLHRDWPKR
jgi:hypothetical protein